MVVGSFIAAPWRKDRPARKSLRRNGRTLRWAMMNKTVERMAGAVVAADKRATHRLASKRGHPAVKLAAGVAELGDQPPLIALSLATAAIGLATRRADLTRGGVRMLAAHLAATGAKNLIKHAVDRARPRHAIETGDDRFTPGDGDDHELTSFPSGHTAGAVAVARAASRDVDGAALPAGLAVAAIAAVQAPSGHHYLLDVAAGAAIGWVAEAMVSAALDRIEPAAARAWERRAA